MSAVMSTTQLQSVVQQVKDLINKSGLVLSGAEWRELTVNDFGLGDIYTEGFAFVDILRTERLRITVIVLLPYQTLPQHLHPPYKGERGKEETLRVLYGHSKVYVEGTPARNINIPPGKDELYTARHEIALNAGEQYTVQPGVKHWFQGGPHGSVNMTYQNRVDETMNIFDDPKSLGCPIKLSD